MELAAAAAADAAVLRNHGERPLAMMKPWAATRGETVSGGAEGEWGDAPASQSRRYRDDEDDAFLTKCQSGPVGVKVIATQGQGYIQVGISKC